MGLRYSQHTSSIFAAALLLAVVLGPTVAYGQARPDTTLPDLAPREVEIRGNLEIVFPSLRRQPLTGFNPPPRIFQIPRGRMPYAGDYKQESANIPGSSLIQPATPPATINVGQNPNRGELVVGLGSYLSREIHGIAAFDLGDDVRANVDLLHDGYDSFKPFTSGPRQDVEAPFFNYQGKAGIEYNLGSSTLGVDGSGFFQKYNLYGLEPAVDSTSTNRPDRDGQGFMLQGAYRGGETSSTPFTIAGGFGSDRYETTWNEASDESKETLFDVTGETRIPLSGQKLQLDGVLGRRSLGFNDGPSDDVTEYHAGGDFAFDLSDKSTLRIGGQIQGYSTTQEPNGEQSVPDTSATSKLYVAPRIEYRNLIAPGLEFYASNAPVVKHTRQRDVYDTNPFTADAPLVLPELSAINLKGGLIYYTGPLRLSADGGYAKYESYLYFDAIADPAPFVGYSYQENYGKVDMYGFGGDVALAFPGSVSLALTGKWARATLPEDEEVPYFPKFETGIRVTYSLPDGRGILQADGKYIGKRFADRAGAEELSGYLDMSAVASYYVTPRIGIYARAKSMTGDRFERWVGYPAADWIVMGGIRLRW